jgi:phosphate transport system substrate-binding protein
MDLPSANAATADKQPLTILQLDGSYPDVTGIPLGYPFWAIEYLYTKGVPDTDTVLKNFIDYLRSSTARAELQNAGYTPCIAKDGQLHHLCRN